MVVETDNIQAGDPAFYGYRHSTTTSCGSGNARLFRRSWSVPMPRAWLVVVHGLGEHSGRYAPLVRALQGHRIAIVSQDLRGHGRSEGRRGHVDRFDDYLVDLGSLLDTVKAEHCGRFLLGHSLGGVIAAHYALDHPGDLSGLILSSPGFVSRVRVPFWKDQLGRVCSRLLPRLTLRTGIEVEALTHDPQMQAAYRADPLIHGVASTRWYSEFLAAGRRCLAQAPRLELPLLAFHGSADSVVSSAGTELFVERARSTDKTMTLFPGLFHETMNECETERSSVLDHVVKWLDRHVNGSD
jgi:alpha-beta hydrolase superfamily lysophospholipase